MINRVALLISFTLFMALTLAMCMIWILLKWEYVWLPITVAILEVTTIVLLATDEEE